MWHGFEDMLGSVPLGVNSVGNQPTDPSRCWGERSGVTRRLRHITLILVVLSTVTACGESPLLSLGNRSSNWINEPKVTTTTLPEVDAPRHVAAATLEWANDVIVNDDLEDPGAVVAAVFNRREGDRFIQASRFEIAAAIPEIAFPSLVPYGAEWVSSQLVVENSGRLSAEPSAAFGIWSAEPYTRSRSVAQMAVLRVSHDPETAADLAEPGAEFSCARFAERITDECALLDMEGRDVWKLAAAGGITLIWFEGPYRYELFGRSFIPSDVLEEMAGDTVALSALNEP